MVTIRFPDGSTLTADTTTALLDALRDEQWARPDPAEFRAMMAHRARVWSDTPVDGRADPDRFVAALAAAGMFTIDDEPTAGDDDR